MQSWFWSSAQPESLGGNTDAYRNKGARPRQALESGETWHNALFTDETSVPLEHCAGLKRGRTILSANQCQSILLTFMSGKWFPDMIGSNHHFLQDNDPKHTASVTCISSMGINWVTTPPESPDLNPIELVRHMMRDLIHKEAKVGTKQELIQAMKYYRKKRLTQDVCDRLITGLNNVVHLIVQNKDGTMKKNMVLCCA